MRRSRRWRASGLAALERFGLELEAAFTGAPAPAPAAAAPAADSSVRNSAARSRAAAQRRSATARGSPPLESELQRRLVEEGLVVRAPDIARVVAVATGRTVEWP